MPMTNPSPSDPPQKSRVPKWLKRTLWACFGLYIVLGTSAWNWIYGLSLALIYPEKTVRELSVHPSCIPGDWVLQTFQPMVSDARMIKHWQEHKADMTLAAEMTANRQHADNNGLTKEARMLYDKISVEDVGAGPSWSLEPYSVENAKAENDCLNKPSPPNESDNARFARVDECTKTQRSAILSKPTFGEIHQQYFCTTQRNTFKQYIYFPGAIPRIVDGYLMGPVRHDGKTIWKRKIVPSTDVYDGTQCTIRQLDARWFISFCG